MDLPPFLLDQWLANYEFRADAPQYNLASSTGPAWTLAHLQDLTGGPDVANLPITYAPPNGSRALREAIAAHFHVDPDWIVVTTGASEALSILFCLAAGDGAGDGQRSIVTTVPRRTRLGARGAWSATCGSVRSPQGLETRGNVARRPAS
jgi:hypothetical protein